jgi:hypothetical protein
MFRRTYTHNMALDSFVLEVLTFKPERLKSIEERREEFGERRRRSE